MRSNTDALLAGHPVSEILQRRINAAVECSRPKLDAQQGDAQLYGRRGIAKDEEMRKHNGAIPAGQLLNNLRQKR